MSCAIGNTRNFEIERNFFRSNHENGPSDAFSGVVQMAVTRVIIGGTIILNTKQTFNITNDTLTRYTTSKRSFYVVSSEDIKRVVLKQ
jgi:hypothetical protein